MQTKNDSTCVVEARPDMNVYSVYSLADDPMMPPSDLLASTPAEAAKIYAMFAWQREPPVMAEHRQVRVISGNAGQMWTFQVDLKTVPVYVATEQS